MKKQMKEISTNFIELDKAKIDEELSKSGRFSSDGISVRKWKLGLGSESKDENKYLCKLEKNGCKYAGILNNKLQRDGYGYEIYSNGDQYFGKFNSDFRGDQGIYFFAPKKKENSRNVLRECFFGEWTSNSIGKNGIYMWLDEPDDNIEFDYANFEAFIGEFEEGKYLRGTYLTKSNDDYSLYHGNFNKDGQKCDNNAYFYSSKFNRIFHGKFVNNSIESGYFGLLNEDEDEDEGVKEIFYCIFNKDGCVNEIIEQKQLNEEEIEDERKNLNNLKNIIFQDIFGKLYIKYKRIKSHMNKLDDIVEFLDDEENIFEINKIINKNSKKNIFSDIEKNIFGKDL